jgi:hypothetical protein
MDVLGTSVLTTAPVTKSAISAALAQSKEKNAKRANDDTGKSLRPHKRILKYNKKYHQKQFT